MPWLSAISSVCAFRRRMSSSPRSVKAVSPRSVSTFQTVGSGEGRHALELADLRHELAAGEFLPPAPGVGWQVRQLIDPEQFVAVGGHQRQARPGWLMGRRARAARPRAPGRRRPGTPGGRRHCGAIGMWEASWLGFRFRVRPRRPCRRCPAPGRRPRPGGPAPDKGGSTRPLAISSSCGPCSTIWPRSSTTSRSALRSVLRRWAMAMVVRPRTRLSSAFWISFSVVVSTEDVASSRIRMRGSISSARAIEMRWRSPPDKA